MEIKLKSKTISGAAIDNALSILRDYGIDEPEIVLEAIGYTLIDTNLFNDYLEIEVKLESDTITNGNIKRAEAVLFDNMDNANETYVKDILQRIGKCLLNVNLYPNRDDSLYQVISYYPSEDLICVKDYYDYDKARKEYDDVIGDFHAIYGLNHKEIEVSNLCGKLVRYFNMQVDGYTGNAYTSIQRVFKEEFD